MEELKERIRASYAEFCLGSIYVRSWPKEEVLNLQKWIKI